MNETQPTSEPVAETSQPVETSAQSAPAPDVEELVRDAERRGYLRGRNESLDRQMSRPSLWQMAMPADPSLPADADDAMIEGFLCRMRPKVWD